MFISFARAFLANCWKCGNVVSRWCCAVQLFDKYSHICVMNGNSKEQIVSYIKLMKFRGICLAQILSFWQLLSRSMYTINHHSSPIDYHSLHIVNLSNQNHKAVAVKGQLLRLSSSGCLLSISEISRNFREKAAQILHQWPVLIVRFALTQYNTPTFVALLLLWLL